MARRQDRLAEHLRDRRRAVVAQGLDGAHDVVGAKRLAAQGEPVELLERVAAELDGVGVALDRDLVAAQVERDARGALDELQARVVAADEGLERLGVVERHLLLAVVLRGHGGLIYRVSPAAATFRAMSSSSGHRLPELVAIMDRLLAPDGCPWDREQTLATLRPFLVEETYEVLDALERGDVAGHREELGDLMMQIVFHAAIRKGEGAFDIDDVIAGIADKLVSRHPHVFGTTTGVDTADKVLAQWEELKAAEKAKKAAASAAGPPRTLAGLPKALPALARAQKLGSRAGKVGFDWPSYQGSLAKVREETDEVAEIARSNDRSGAHEEIGDLLFAVVNLARKLDVDAESALHDACTKFVRRFEFIEDRLAENGRKPEQATLEELDALWDKAKAERSRESDAFLSKGP